MPDARVMCARMSAATAPAPDRSSAHPAVSRRDTSSGDDRQKIEAAVRRAWRSVVGRRGVAGGLTLVGAGCDSLRFLQFAMTLERELGHPVPLDLIDTEMRADEIVTSLAGSVQAPPAVDQRPTVFLMPGLDDDEQRLARFRVALQPHARFILANYPDWPEMMHGGWNFTELAEVVTDQVLRQIDGPVLLTGYSFGGEVGFAVACRLQALGRSVRWFGILDADITRVPPPPSGGPVARLQRYLREMAEDVRHEGLHKTTGLMVAKLGRQAVGLRRMHRAMPWLRKLPPRTEFWIHRRTRSILRIQALWAWLDGPEPPRLDLPVTLFASQAGAGLSPPDLGWAPRCSNLTIVPVTGDHHTLFDSPHREVLCARYAEALQAVAREARNSEAAARMP